jgi:hypothetical protein
VWLFTQIQTTWHQVNIKKEDRRIVLLPPSTAFFRTAQARINNFAKLGYYTAGISNREHILNAIVTELITVKL